MDFNTLNTYIEEMQFEFVIRGQATQLHTSVYTEKRNSCNTVRNARRNGG